jgi:hypothetical protein
MFYYGTFFASESHVGYSLDLPDGTYDFKLAEHSPPEGYLVNNYTSYVVLLY